MKRFVSALLLMSALGCANAWAATPLKTPRPMAKPAAIAKLAAFPKHAMQMKHLAKLVNRARAPEGRFGYVLMDALTGEVLSGRNEDALFIPASLAKIPTSIAALAACGGERQFETRLLADGPIVNGTLEGDLHLVGSGDPSLRSRDLQSLTDALATAGIRKVSGRFYHHADSIPQTSMINRRQPKGAHYNPGVSGLNVDLNIRRDKNGRASISRPDLQVVATLRRFARARGIQLPKSIEATMAPVGTEIGVHRSKMLTDLMRDLLATSNNMTAEALGAAAAIALGAAPKSLSDAASTTSDWIIRNSALPGGTGWEGFHLENHSGLSSRSRATPRQMAAILRYGYQTLGSSFVDLYRDESKGASSLYSIRAKIGTMRFVRGLGGFLNVGGRDMIFTIMSNDDKRRAAADAGRSRLGSAPWMHKARKLEQALLSDWLAAYWPRTAGL